MARSKGRGPWAHRRGTHCRLRAPQDHPEKRHDGRNNRAANLVSPKSLPRVCPACGQAVAMEVQAHHWRHNNRRTPTKTNACNADVYGQALGRRASRRASAGQRVGTLAGQLGSVCRWQRVETQKLCVPENAGSDGGTAQRRPCTLARVGVAAGMVAVQGHSTMVAQGVAAGIGTRKR